MNVLNAYSIYDKAAEVYNPPFFLQTHAVAIRQFEDQVRQPDSVLQKHPEDFSLKYIGLFNTETGSMEKASDNQQLAKATDYIKIED